MQQTIQYVNPETRTWEGPNGPVVFVSGQFIDGSGWSVGAKPETAEDRIATLTALVGVEGEYELEAKAEYQGKPQWKIKSWPGKPVWGGAGGGGAPRAPRDESGMAIGAAGHDAATIVAACVTKGFIASTGMALLEYQDLVGKIYEHNQGLKPGAQSGVPTPPARDVGRPTGKAVSPATGDWGAAGLPGEAGPAAPCSHDLVSETKVDGNPLPKGFVRCMNCHYVFKAMA